MCVTRLLEIVIFVGYVCGAHADESCSGIRTLHKKDCGFEVILDIPTDHSGVYNFVLNASMQIYSNTDMDVVLENEAAVRDGTANFLTYVVTHPTCSSCPRVTRLVFNKHVLCTNPPYDVSVGLPATQLFFESTHYGKTRSEDNKRKHQTYTTNNYHEKGSYSDAVSQQQRHDNGDETCSGIRSLQKTYCSHAVVLTIPSDGSGTYIFKLNASMQIYSHDRIKVVLENEDAVKYDLADVLRYVITHPSCDKYPLVTRLEFNGKVICTNKKYDVLGGEPTTQFYVESIVYGQKRNKRSFNFNINQMPIIHSKPIINGEENIYQNNPFLKSTAGKIVGNIRIPSNPDSPSESEIKSGFSGFLNTKYPHSFKNNPFLAGKYNGNNSHNLKNINNSSRQISPQYNNNLPHMQVSNKECGFLIHPLIQGGDNVLPGEYPWLGALFKVGRNESNYKCTVNLISKRQVLTAAHCVDGNIKAPYIFWVVFGFMNNPANNYIYVHSIRIHPEYQRGQATHDVAVLILKETNRISLPQPICVWQDNNKLPDAGIVAGFGPDYTSFRMLTMPVVTQEECRGSHPHFHQVTSEFTFCAGSRDNRGPCRGDSGAGFMQWVSNRYYLRGLVSLSLSANNDCNLSEYLIFSDLSKETEWIQEVLTSSSN